MASPAGTRSRTTKALIERVVALTEQIRGVQESTDDLAAQRREAMCALVNRVGYGRAAELTGMSKTRAHQIANG